MVDSSERSGSVRQAPSLSSTVREGGLPSPEESDISLNLHPPPPHPVTAIYDIREALPNGSVRKTFGISQSPSYQLF